MKTCTKCGEEKFETEFYVAAPGRLTPLCKKCCAARSVLWAAQNKDKVAAARKVRYKKYRAINIANARKWARDHPLEKAALNKAWKQSNPEKVRAHAETFYRKHAEKVRAESGAYRKANPDKINALGAKRRAQRLQATPKWADPVTMDEYYWLAAWKTKETGEPWHVDHQVPLQSKLVCGLHTDYNLQVIRGTENASKGNRHWPDMPEARA